MRIIRLNRLEARFLRENLVNAQEGYDYTDLCRMDALAKRLTELQGEYAVSMAEVARTERQIRRSRARGDLAPAEADAALTCLQFDVEDLNEAAATIAGEFRVEDGDWKLIVNKLDAVSSWLATDIVRSIVLGMVAAVREAETEGVEPVEPKKLRSVKG